MKRGCILLCALWVNLFSVAYGSVAYESHDWISPSLLKLVLNATPTEDSSCKLVAFDYLKPFAAKDIPATEKEKFMNKFSAQEWHDLLKLAILRTKDKSSEEVARGMMPAGVCRLKLNMVRIIPISALMIGGLLLSSAARMFFLCNDLPDDKVGACEESRINEIAVGSGIFALGAIGYLWVKAGMNVDKKRNDRLKALEIHSAYNLTEKLEVANLKKRMANLKEKFGAHYPKLFPGFYEIYGRNEDAV